MEKFLSSYLFKRGQPGTKKNSPDVLAREHLWNMLRTTYLNGYRFRSQQPFGNYILDFVCFRALLIIEIDDRRYFETDDDRTRREWLSQVGFKVLHFQGNDILHDVEQVLKVIQQHLKRRQ